MFVLQPGSYFFRNINNIHWYKCCTFGIIGKRKFVTILSGCREILRVEVQVTSYKSLRKMSHVWWVITVNRISCLYSSTPTPSYHVIILASNIVKLYAPVLFRKRTHSSCKGGSRHLWKLIESSPFLSSALQSIINPDILNETQILLALKIYFWWC